MFLDRIIQKTFELYIVEDTSWLHNQKLKELTYYTIQKLLLLICCSINLRGKVKKI